jgi:hypothetical protein
MVGSKILGEKDCPGITNQMTNPDPRVFLAAAKMA